MNLRSLSTNVMSDIVIVFHYILMRSFAHCVLFPAPKYHTSCIHITIVCSTNFRFIMCRKSLKCSYTQKLLFKLLYLLIFVVQQMYGCYICWLLRPANGKSFSFHFLCISNTEMWFACRLVCFIDDFCECVCVSVYAFLFCCYCFLFFHWDALLFKFYVFTLTNTHTSNV